MGLLITLWRAQPVPDLMEFDSFHWRLPHTAMRHSKQHKQANTNCPLCLLTGSNISYRVFPAFFFFFENIPNYFFPLCSLISYLSPLLLFLAPSPILQRFLIFIFVCFSSTLSFFPGSLVPEQQLCIPIVSGNKPRKKG